MTVIQERSNSNVPTVHYTRGLDLSGSLGGAGGIGGLLIRSSGYNDSTGAWSTHDHYHADGSGNITLLISNSTTPTIRAQYEYDPFGRIQTQSGTLATTNTQRFSSKEQIGSSPLSYYGFRFYHAEAQRWINRDPFGSVTSQMNAEMFGTDAAAFYEEGIFDPELLPEGPNIYGYVGNNPVNVVDPSGEVVPIVAVAAVAAVRGGFIAYRAYRSYRAAAARAGQSMIACSRSAAQRIATQAGKGARPVRHAPLGPRPDYRPHYHPGGNTPPHTHIWW